MAVSSTRSQARPLINWGRFLSQAQTILLVAVTSMFVVIHGRNVLDGHWISTPFAVEQVILVVLFLVRRKSIATSARPFDWTVAAIGSWLPLAMQPADGPAQLGQAGFAIQLGGIALGTVCFLALGRSFGIVAANRGLKTHGPYSFVRHPIYLAHIISGAGFVMANPSYLNVSIWTIGVVAQTLRIRAEERVLTESGPYAEYKGRVRWRLAPGIY